MAALGFFRKNQKLVFWVMVLLMVMFLVTIGGYQSIVGVFAPRPDRQAIGRAGQFDVTPAILRQSEQDVTILREYIGLGNVLRVLAYPPGVSAVPGEHGFLLLTAQRQDSLLTWTLLLNEAREMGIVVSEPAVDDFLLLIGFDQQLLNQRLAEIRQLGLTERDFRRAIQNYLLIAHAFSSVSDVVPESEPGLRRYYRDLTERMRLAMVRFDADDYLDQVEQPSDAAIVEQFRQGRNLMAGAEDNPDPFRFGYNQPDKVQMEYILVRWDDILAAAEPGEDEMIRYWNQNRGQLTREVPVEIPADPENPDAPTTQLVNVPIEEYFEAKPQIREILREQTAQRRQDEIVNQTLRQVRQNAGTDDIGPLGNAARRMLDAGAPIDYRRYPRLLTREQIQQDAVLGQAYTGTGAEGQSLADMAFSVKEFHRDDPRHVALVEVGRVVSQALDVRGERRGKLIWSISNVEAGGPPEQFTEEIREQVIADLRTKAAYEIAVERAEQTLAKVPAIGLQAAAGDFGKTITVTDPLPRKVAESTLNPGSFIGYIRMAAVQLYQWMLNGRQGEPPAGLDIPPEWYFQAALVPPVVVRTPEVPLVEPALAADFLENAFALAPADARSEVVSRHAAEPVDLDVLTLVHMPLQRAVYVVQRVEWTPASEQEYESMRMNYLGQLVLAERHKMLTDWYAAPNVLSRTGFAYISNAAQAQDE